jgi:VanZ family protein
VSWIKLYWKALLWAFLILGACGINGDKIPKVSFDFGIDKIVHFILFGLLALLIYLPQRKYLILGILLSCLYGVVIEFLQMTVFTNRSFDYADMVADAIGALLCYPLVKLAKI